VQELAALSLLAQTAQPVLAHQVVEVAAAALRDVPVGAPVAQRAVALEVRLAYRSCVRDPEALCGDQKGTEGERVVWVLMGEDLLGEVVRPRGLRQDLGFHGGSSECVRDVVATDVVNLWYVWGSFVKE
jgi:hypothetical protein